MADLGANEVVEQGHSLSHQRRSRGNLWLLAGLTPVAASRLHGEGQPPVAQPLLQRFGHQRQLTLLLELGAHQLAHLLGQLLQLTAGEGFAKPVGSNLR